MRIATRVLVGAGAATLLAVGAPVAANASTAAPVTAATATTAGAPYSFDHWGPYFSGNGKSKASGKVVVHKKSEKKGYWKKYPKVVKKCWWKNGEKKCAWVKTWEKKWVGGWVHTYHHTVDSKLTNYKWWGNPKNRCAWATFKIVDFDGSVDFRSVKNCGKGTEYDSFSGENAKAIYVKVSRGSHYGPKGYAPWHEIYSHA
ncbi:hypothetical protein ACFOWE_17800 [Planomonospora corallina]|uniref:Uncharacterized protein n=1 Tax=Planomonospora corallina TaxID=1806052 RepID=A0ABV8IAX5_9ACTN